ncbi:MAG: hypothetical protein J2P57_11415, partial [Acidimicrobiaceae bacterium]|nr:hypothetical protein [Acidimicrobiaceae bacterium]
MTAPSSQSSPQVRLVVLMISAGCLFAALLARLWFLQVVNAPSAQVAATNNGVRYVYNAAPRGDILDVNGNVLVGKVTVPVIEVSRQTAATDPAMVARLAALIGMTTKQLNQAINNLQYSPYAPVPVLTEATPQQILHVQENPALFPGVSATTETQSEYSALGKATANIVGYVGQIDASQYAQLKSKGYQPGDQIGETGIEAQYESVLRGTPGVEKVAVDARGDVLSVLSSTPPIPGDSIRLTIDGKVQEAALQALEAGEVSARHVIDPVTHRDFAAPDGAVVVQRPSDGTIVALATNPDYDPSLFVGGISSANYAKLQSPSADDPLLDRTIAGLYNPGSTFKLVTATAGFKYGLITPTSTFDDTGGVKVGTGPGSQFFSNDNHAAYGVVNVQQAITVSSDAFFYNIGLQLYEGRARFGDTALQQVANAYGFASHTGIDLPGGASGYVLTPAQKAKLHAQFPKDYPYATWFPGDNVQSAVGEDDVVVTPLQEANAYSAFANGGTLWTPRLAQDAETPAGKVTKSYTSKPIRRITLPPQDHAAMLNGFIGVANSGGGTAYK